jgi:hypothetical protein
VVAVITVVTALLCLAFLCFVKAGCISYVGFLMFNLLEVRGRCCLSRLKCKVKGFHVFFVLFATVH